MQMQVDRETGAAKVRAYRQRISAAGDQEVLLRLPKETVAFLDSFKQRQGLRNRGQALLRLIEQGRAATQ
jgi:hypothetical protein